MKFNVLYSVLKRKDVTNLSFLGWKKIKTGFVLFFFYLFFPPFFFFFVTELLF